jgi:hypothetical protein
VLARTSCSTDEKGSGVKTDLTPDPLFSSLDGRKSAPGAIGGRARYERGDATITCRWTTIKGAKWQPDVV